MKAMILAAGLGTRLGELTESIPKPMLDINGKPLLEYNIRNLVKYGFDEIIINLHFLPAIIKNFAGDGRKFGARIEYSVEEELLGTAGGVKRVEDFFDSEPFLVLYGDLLTNQDLGLLYAEHKAHKALATLILHQRAGSNSLVKLESSGEITGFVERPSAAEREKYPFSWVNSGIQILHKEVLAGLEKNTYADLPKDIYPTLVDRKDLYGVPLTGERVAIDSPERYMLAKRLAAEWNN